MMVEIDMKILKLLYYFLTLKLLKMIFYIILRRELRLDLFKKFNMINYKACFNLMNVNEKLGFDDRTTRIHEYFIEV